MDPLDTIARLLGVDPTMLAVAIPVAILIFNLIGRAIPDDATGFLGLVRRVAKVLGLYLSNRVASGVTVNDASRIALDRVGVPIPPADLDTTNQRVEAVTGEKIFPGFKTTERDEKGRFLPKNGDAKIESHWIVGVLVITITAFLLSGCTGMGGLNSAGSVICSRQDEARVGLIAALARAESIADPVRREAAIGAIRTSLAALDKCPVKE